jgi:hypothetical protein
MVRLAQRGPRTRARSLDLEIDCECLAAILFKFILDLLPFIERIQAWRHTSATCVPLSACWSANAICCSVNFDLFIDQPPFELEISRILIQNGLTFRDDPSAHPLPRRSICAATASNESRG